MSKAAISLLDQYQTNCEQGCTQNARQPGPWSAGLQVTVRLIRQWVNWKSLCPKRTLKLHATPSHNQSLQTVPEPATPLSVDNLPIQVNSQKADSGNEPLLQLQKGPWVMSSPCSDGKLMSSNIGLMYSKTKEIAEMGTVQRQLVQHFPHSWDVICIPAKKACCTLADSQSQIMALHCTATQRRV